MTHTLLAVPVPEADALVRRLASEWEPTYDLGSVDDIQAHITVLGPFVPIDEVDDHLHDRLRQHCAKKRVFPYRLAQVALFAENVVYLAPEPAQTFRELTLDAEAAFPGYPHYGGKFAITPHMTVGPIRSPDMEQALLAAARAPFQGPLRRGGLEVAGVLGAALSINPTRMNRSTDNMMTV